MNQESWDEALIFFIDKSTDQPPQEGNQRKGESGGMEGWKKQCADNQSRDKAKIPEIAEDNPSEE